MSTDAVAPAQELRITTEKKPDEILFVCTGRITSNTGELLKSTVRPLMADTKRVVINLAGVTYMDSSGIGALVSLWVTSKRSNCELKLTNLSDRIKDVLKVTNLATTLAGDQEYFGM
jgi:anti-sigma B factor antagonist